MKSAVAKCGALEEGWNQIKNISLRLYSFSSFKPFNQYRLKKTSSKIYTSREVLSKIYTFLPRCGGGGGNDLTVNYAELETGYRAGNVET